MSKWVKLVQSLTHFFFKVRCHTAVNYLKRAQLTGARSEYRTRFGWNQDIYFTLLFFRIVSKQKKFYLRPHGDLAL